MKLIFKNLTIPFTFFFLFFSFTSLANAQSTAPLLVSPQIISAGSISSTVSSSNSSSNTTSGISIKNSTGTNFSLKLTPGVQDIFSLKIPVQLDIESFLDVDRFEISNIISPDPEAFTLSIPNNILGSLKKGEKKSVVFYAEPKKPGLTSIYITGQAWQNDLTLTDVAFITVNIDKNLWVTPQSDEFKKNTQTWQNIKTFATFVVVLVILLILFLLVRKFAKWWKHD